LITVQIDGSGCCSERARGFDIVKLSVPVHPAKRKTSVCVLVGAFPGAMPPLIGWAAASGRLDSEAWMLYAILFLWQFPHFTAIAWMYRETMTSRISGLAQGNARIPFVTLETLLPCWPWSQSA